jgi:hypothetical protein
MEVTRLARELPDEDNPSIYLFNCDNFYLIVWCINMKRLIVINSVCFFEKKDAFFLEGL